MKTTAGRQAASSAWRQRGKSGSRICPEPLELRVGHDAFSS